MPISPLSNGLTGNRTAWTAVTLYVVVLTYLLLTPHPLWFLGVSGRAIEKAVDSTLWGCVQHALAYCLLACLLSWASRTTSAVGQAVWMSLAVVHGIAAEWLQSFVPHRYAGWPDGVANALGVGLGWLGAMLILSSADKPLKESVA